MSRHAIASRWPTTWKVMKSDERSSIQCFTPKRGSTLNRYLIYSYGDIMGKLEKNTKLMKSRPLFDKHMKRNIPGLVWICNQRQRKAQYVVCAVGNKLHFKHQPLQARDSSGQNGGVTNGPKKEYIGRLPSRGRGGALRCLTSNSAITQGARPVGL